MGISGADWVQPSLTEALRWGADFGPVTLSGECWRLITSNFVHFGIFHIALNMWCLWGLGKLLEPQMGRKAFAVMYVLSGLGGSITSLAWHPWFVSAGASGAIFGAAGALLSFLLLKKTSLDQGLIKKNLKSLVIFILYNLARGISGETDNAAHIGGLMTGIALGAIIPSLVRAASTLKDPSAQSSLPESVPPPDVQSFGEESNSRATWTIAVCAALIAVIAVTTLREKDIALVQYGKGVESARAGHLDERANELQQAITTDPKQIYGLILLGEVRLEANNPQAAIAPLESAIGIGDYLDVRHDLALAYLGAGMPADAMSRIESALPYEKGSEWQARFILATAQEETGQTSQALANFEAVLGLKPDFAEAKAAVNALSLSGKSQPSDKPAQSLLPYDKLLMKSAAWPYSP